MQWLNLSYSAWFNRRHRRAGYLFQGRFKSVIVDPAAYGASLSAYLHLNPVRVARLGLSKTDQQRARATRIEAPAPQLIAERLRVLREYRWSSYRAYLRPKAAPPWLHPEPALESLGGPRAERHANYRRFVEDQLRQGVILSPWEQTQDRAILAADDFLETLRQTARAALPRSAKPPRWAAQPVELAQVIAAVEKARGQKWPDFKDLHGHPGRDSVLFLARRATRLTVAQLAQAVGLKTAAHVSMANKRYVALLQRNRPERKLAAQAAKLLEVYDLTLPTLLPPPTPKNSSPTA